MGIIDLSIKCVQNDENAKFFDKNDPSNSQSKKKGYPGPTKFFVKKGQKATCFPNGRNIDAALFT